MFHILELLLAFLLVFAVVFIFVLIGSAKLWRKQPIVERPFRVTIVVASVIFGALALATLIASTHTSP